MCKNKEGRKVLFGNEEYEYTKNKNGEEYLTKNERVGDQEISIVLKSTMPNNSKNIEKYIIDVLSDLYIQRNVKKLI